MIDYLAKKCYYNIVLEVEKLFSIQIAIENKQDIMNIYEILTKFPNEAMLIKCGENTIDAHSIMGFFSLDTSSPLELMLYSEPSDELKNALSQYVVNV